MKAMLALAVSLCSVSAAWAETFEFTYAGPDGLSGTVIVSGHQTSPGVFDVTSGTDVVTGGTSLTGVFSIVPNPDFPTVIVGSRFAYDDALFPDSSTFLDSAGGPLFSNASGFINLYTVGSDFLSGTSTTPGSSDVVITVSALTVVPEPRSMAMLGMGLAGLAAMRRHARRGVCMATTNDTP